MLHLGQNPYIKICQIYSPIILILVDRFIYYNNCKHVLLG